MVNAAINEAEREPTDASPEGEDAERRAQSLGEEQSEENPGADSANVEAVKTPEQTQIPEITEEKRRFFEELARQSDAHTKGLEATMEPHNLAKTLGKTAEIDGVLLTSYLEAKKGLFGEDSPEGISQELMKVETKLIQPLILELKRNELSLTEEQIENCIVAAREAFFGMILNGTLSAEKISEVLDGKIMIHQVPGSEVSEEHREVKDMVSYIAYDKDQRCFNMHLYKDFFNDSSEDMAFVMRHEFMHSAAVSIWGERYGDFREAAKNPSENIAAFKDIPELQQVLILVANPKASKPFFRKYISDLLEAAEAATDSAHKSFYQQRAAIEIVADLGASFLEGSKSADVFLDLRARLFADKPDELIKTICTLEGVSDREALFQKYSINPAEVPPRKIIYMLSQSPNLQALFRTSQIWQDQLTKRFANKGEQLKRPEFNDEFTEEDLEGWDEFEPVGAFSTGRAESATTSGKGAGTGGGLVESALSIWDILTGRKAA